MTDTTPNPETPRAESPFREAWRMFLHNHAAVAALIVLLGICFIAVFGPSLYPTDPFEMVWAPFSPPGEQGFIFGTDYLGRDLAAMILNGARVSLLIGAAAAIVSILIGVTIGAVAGFFGGLIEEVLMQHSLTTMGAICCTMLH